MRAWGGGDISRATEVIIEAAGSGVVARRAKAGLGSFWRRRLVHQNSLAIFDGLIRQRKPSLSHSEKRKFDFRVSGALSNFGALSGM